MSEKTIQESMQSTIRGISTFTRKMIVINDWTVLDEAAGHGFRVIIENMDTIDSRRDVTTPTERYEIPVMIYQPYVDWKTTLDAFRDNRQLILDEFNAVGTSRAAGTTGTNIQTIRNDGPIGYVFETYTEPDFEPEALPIFVQQRLIFEANLF